MKLRLVLIALLVLATTGIALRGEKAQPRRERRGDVVHVQLRLEVMPHVDDRDVEAAEEHLPRTIGRGHRGAVALEARRVAAGVVSAAQMPEAFTLLAGSRPTAVNLFWALERMRSRWLALGARPTDAVAAELLAEAQRMRAEDIAANETMGRLGAALLRDRSRVLTHCNAGALATAGHGTALGIIRSAVQAGKRIDVFAFYDDFNWSGSGFHREWHGQSIYGLPHHHVGSATAAP